MKHFIYLLLNVAIGALLFYTYYDKQQEYMPALSTVECLTEQKANKVFCAQCVWRSQQTTLQASKAIVVESNEQYAILKLKDKINKLTCGQLLYLPNYEKSDKGMRLPFELETLPSITELVKELEGELLSIPTEFQVVSAQYNQFVIYRWFSLTEQKKTSVKIANPSQITIFKGVLAYAVCGIILLFIALYFYNKETFSHLKRKVLISIAILLVLLETLTLDLVPGNEMILIAVRVIILSIFLMRIEENSFIITISLLLGYASTIQSVTFLSYLTLVLIYIFVKGMNEQNTNEIWTYILVSLFIYTVNQYVWYLMFKDIADAVCQFVELIFLVYTPIGLTLIKDAKYVGFKVYKPNDQKRHAISLSGYEEEEEEEDSNI